MSFYRKRGLLGRNGFQNEEVPFPTRSYIQVSQGVKGNVFLKNKRKDLKKIKGNFYINKGLSHKGIPQGIKSIWVKDHMESMFNKFEDSNVIDSFYNFLFASNDNHLGKNQAENEVFNENFNYDLNSIDSNGNTQEKVDSQNLESNEAENNDEEFTNQVLDWLTEAILEADLDDETVVIDDFEYDEICDNYEEEITLRTPSNLDEKDIEELDFILQDVLLDLIDVDDSSGVEVEQEWENIIDVAFNVQSTAKTNCFNFGVEEQEKHKFGDKFYFAEILNEYNNFEEYGINYLSDKAIFDKDFIIKMKKQIRMLLCNHEDCPPPCYLFLNNNDREFLHKYMHPPSHSPSFPATDIINRTNKAMSFNLRRHEINHLPIPPRETDLILSYEEEKRLSKYSVSLSELGNQRNKMAKEDIIKAKMMNRMWL